jgi:hypothetical protein
MQCLPCVARLVLSGKSLGPNREATHEGFVEYMRSKMRDPVPELADIRALVDAAWERR